MRGGTRWVGGLAGAHWGPCILHAGGHKEGGGMHACALHRGSRSWKGLHPPQAIP